VNQVHFEKNVPVTLAVVPDPHTKGLDSQVFQFGHDQPIGGVTPIVSLSTNNELLQDPAFFAYMWSISSNPLFEFAQHGYSHKNDGLSHNFTSEFSGEPYTVQYEAIQKGRDDIKDAFGITPTTFIPPFDRGDRNTLEALQALGFTEYCSGATDFKTLQGQTGAIRIEPSTVDIEGANYTALANSVQLAKNKTDQFLNDPNNDTLIVAYHWWTFAGPGGSVDTRKVQLLRDYIDYVKTKNVQFTRLDRQATVNTETAGAGSSLMNVSDVLTPYQLWLVGGVGVAFLLGFAWFVVSGRGGRK